MNESHSSMMENPSFLLEFDGPVGIAETTARGEPVDIPWKEVPTLKPPSTGLLTITCQGQLRPKASATYGVLLTGYPPMKRARWWGDSDVEEIKLRGVSVLREALGGLGLTPTSLMEIMLSAVSGVRLRGSADKR